MTFWRKRNSDGRTDASPTLERLVRRSLTALAVERLSRIAAGLATLLLFFLAVSFSGLWLEIGATGRALGVGAFAVAALWIVGRGLVAGTPRRREALARLDASAGAHRPAASLEDTLSGDAPDSATSALWALHRSRLERKLATIEVAPPDPGLPRRDPFALRAAALVAAVAAAFVAGPDRTARLLSAFDWESGAGAASGARVDAWFDPPAYTGRPPIVLPQRAEGPWAQVSVPVNATLVVHSFGARGAAAASGGLAPIEGGKQRQASGETEERFKLTGDAAIALRGAGEFRIQAIPDRAPTIEITQPPRNNARGTMTLGFRTDDDYGVVSAEAVAALPAAAHPSRSLYPPPRLALPAPPTRGGLGETKATLDFSDHPWAGARVALTLVAHDEGGNDGHSAPLDVTLPERRFAKPLARALAEQRRNLALDPDHHARVLTAVGALSLGSALFETPSSVFLGLSAAKGRLETARDDADLREVADLIWAMALSLEEGDVSQAERDLRAAQKDLREALARGASEEEIAKLTQDMRAALENFLNGLGQKNGKNAERSAPERGDQRVLTEDDLQSMLSEIEKAERAGDFAEAQRLLDDLQDVLENLRPAQAGRADPRAREMSRALEEIDKLTREEQQLRDETNRGQQSGGQQSGGEPRRGGKGQSSASDETRARQKSLRDRLEREQDRLRRSGEASPDLADADKAMKEAEKALGPGGEGTGRAVDAQGRALQALRRGADQLASRMQGEGEEGEGQSGRAGRRAGMRPGEGADPLGRPTGRQRGQEAGARYDPLGLPPAVRARRVQEELRRRLGQPERPAEELDYFERLLRR
ncbi:TIGR02302 family protein [Methylosinus sp. H3A]|uniref:TIGR02302 family protein n=1 Tax=Methylosinus sp. H3A TaxID=2785786 RepID=UPI0018C2B74E|nr:TIGR02302 family protein [Methylosinus sp. H3A]MBG0809075.1 TIGR02302 family protein [Methylosinus sp. H3A]